MSQPPYPSPGSDAGGDGPAGGGPGAAGEWDDAARADRSPTQPVYGQSQYAQPQHAQASYGPASYGQPPYGPAAQGQPPYGQVPYGQPPYGRPGPDGPVPPWGRPPTAPATSRKLVVGLMAGLALLIAVVAVALVVVLRSDGDSSGGSGSAIPEATSDPEGLGDDPLFDDYAEDCHDGDMEACDDLFRESPLGSAYELYGGTCAGRQSDTDAREIFCVRAFPPAA